MRRDSFLFPARSFHSGGIIVTMPMSREEVEAILAEDPFVREGVSEYDIREMKPTKRHDVLRDVL